MIGEKRVKIGVCCLFTSFFVLTENRTTRGVSVCLSVYIKSVSSLLNVEFIKNDEVGASELCLCVIQSVA